LCDGSVNSIFDAGFGAVELCQTCYKCGAKDGVCPEEYSDGTFETNTLKTNVTMRVQRPEKESSGWSIYTVAYNTGNAACDSISGDCDHIQRSVDGNPFINFGSCSLDVSDSNIASNNATFRAICNNVPKKSGCENCPDPDCKTMVRGKTYKLSTGDSINGVQIRVTSSTGIDVKSSSNGDGEFSFPVAELPSTGNVFITCSHGGYDNYVKNVYLQPGINIFDCQMTSFGCDANCVDINKPGVCDANCDGIGGCVFPNSSVKTYCDKKAVGSVYPGVSSSIFVGFDGCKYEDLTMTTCCIGDKFTNTLQIANSCPGQNITAGGGTLIANVSNMITRNYRKELNGLPVTLKIIVYTK